jgi:15-cis-phytoene desaturase
MKTAVIVGGGLAGLAAAQHLAASGRVRPVVLEADGRLGGRAASWRDAGGALHEVGLHVCFPHYRQVIGLVERLGVHTRLSWGDSSLNYVHAGGHVAKLRFPCLPHPLNGALAIARHAPLSAWDRFSALAGAIEAAVSTPGWRSRYETISFAEWGQRRGLSRRLMATLFEPIVGGLTFLRGDQVSAQAMLDYIHAVGSRRASGRIGLFRAGSGEVLVEPLAQAVRRHGGEIHLRSPARRLLMRAGRAVGVALQDGRTLEADIVIAAVPSHGLRPMLPEGLIRHEALAGAMSLRPVAVASVMLWLDRRVGGPIGLRLSPGCVFNTWADMSDQLPELAASPQSVLQLVVAPLDIGLNDEELVSRVVSDVRKLLPGARDAKVLRSVVTRTPRSVHASVPGAAALRPDNDIAVHGLLLAGDYTRTGHSPNMESAVSSGLAAARLALEALS